MGVDNFAKWTYEAGPIHTDLPGRSERAAEFIEAVRTGIRKAKTKPCGPILIGLPQDVAETRWIAWSQLESNREYLSVDAPVSSNEIDSVAEFIAAHSRPTILLDDYLLKYDLAQETLANFSAAIGAPVLQLRYRRGPMLFERVNPKQVPAFLGWFNPADKDRRRVIAEADLLITLEDRNLYPRVVGELSTPRKLAITSNRRKVIKNLYLREQDRLVM